MSTPDAHTHLSCFLNEEQEFSFPACICSTQPCEWNKLAAFARRLPGKIIPSFGIHPWYIDESSLVHMEDLSNFLHEFPEAGIGEIGIDHTKRASASLDFQQIVFENQLYLSTFTNRVVSIHCVKAWGRVLESLEKIHPSRILIHGWKGSSELLPRLHALDCYFSVGLYGIEEKSIYSLPSNRILVESDELCGSIPETTARLISLRKDLNESILQKNFEFLWQPTQALDHSTKA